MLRQVSNYSNLPNNLNSVHSKSTKQKPGSSKQSLGRQKGSSITIKFIGNVKENIKQIVQSLQCSDYCKQEVSYILEIYASKVEKLREERDYFKKLASLQEENKSQLIFKLRKRVEQLEQLNLINVQYCSCGKCTCLDGHQLFSQQYSNIQQGCFVSASGSSVVGDLSNKDQCSQEEQKNNDHQFTFPLMKKISQEGQESILIENESMRQEQTSKSQVRYHLSQNQSLVNDLSQMGDDLNEFELMKIMLKYNFSLPELEQILEDYQNQYKMIYQMFDSQKQRDLYVLGQKMQKGLKNKKILSDVKKLSMMKSEALNRSSRSINFES